MWERKRNSLNEIETDNQTVVQFNGYGYKTNKDKYSRKQNYTHTHSLSLSMLFSQSKRIVFKFVFGLKQKDFNIDCLQLK